MMSAKLDLSAVRYADAVVVGRVTDDQHAIDLTARKTGRAELLNGFEPATLLALVGYETAHRLRKNTNY